jgi:hypothetical protein
MTNMDRAANAGSTEDPDCSCLERGPPSFDDAHTRFVGVDETDGRFADVTLCRCPRCSRTWLRYQLEYEAFTASGRWCMAPIDATLAASVKPETAAGVIAEAEWHIFGGSYFGHAGKRGRGRIHWGL